MLSIYYKSLLDGAEHSSDCPEICDVDILTENIKISK